MNAPLSEPRSAPREVRSPCTVHILAPGGLAPGGPCVLRISGSVDWRDAPVLQAEIVEAAARADAGIDVDLGALDFADASLLHLLLDVQRRCRARGTQLRIGSRIQTVVERLFHLTGAHCYFVFTDQDLPGQGPDLPE